MEKEKFTQKKSFLSSYFKEKQLQFDLFFCRTLGEAWTQLKKSLHDEAEVHLKFSNKVTSAD